MLMINFSIESAQPQAGHKIYVNYPERKKKGCDLFIPFYDNECFRRELNRMKNKTLKVTKLTGEVEAGYYDKTTTIAYLKEWQVQEKGILVSNYITA